MFGINFDSLNKFHISIGIGLMVVSVMIILITTLETHNYLENARINQIDDTREDFKLMSELKEKNLSELSSQYKNVSDLELNVSITQVGYNQEILKSLKVIYTVLFWTGAFFFFIGYIPWLINTCKKRKND